MSAAVQEATPKEIAAALHEQFPVADLHIDTLLSHELLGYDMLRRHQNKVPFAPLLFHADLPRAREAGLNIWGLGLVTWPMGDPIRLFKHIERELLYMNRVCAQYPEEIYVITDKASLADGVAKNRVGCFAGIEGAHAISGNLDRLRRSYDLGMRYFTMAHFSCNEACACAKGWGAKTRTNEGLTPFGRTLLDTLHKMSIVVDLSHINKKGFMECCERSDRPVMVSHTGLSGVFPSWRNIDDEQVEAVAKNGGVIGVIFGPQFLNGALFNCTIDDLVDHMLHVIRIAGADHVAYGSDTDGWLATMPKGFRGIEDLPLITQRLLERGVAVDDVKKIMGGNVERLLNEILA
ncbi:MAG: membrane dipeptidase [Deltaproteobacteria bacterium]|nr:membrane dipeptidase [Deltaproteobacteria bacterium]MCB9489497.1 membrane dipeptidase [Deltaproteobacteria bacterium]